MTRPGPVLVVGDLVADVRVDPSDSLRPGDEVEGEVSLHGGGSSANEAIWLARAGTRVRFVGRVGNDLFGTALVDEIEREGVEVAVARDPGFPTGMVAAVIDEAGERALVTSRGANARLEDTDVPPTFWEGASLLLLTGYVFTRPDSALAGRALMAEAARRSLPVAIDPASARLFLAYPGRDLFLEWTAGARWCFPSASEALALAGSTSEEEAARTLLTCYEGVVVTRAAGGSLIATRAVDGLISVPSLSPAPRIIDAFAAGFLSSSLSGKEPERCTVEGQRLAARALAMPGARDWGLFRATNCP